MSISVWSTSSYFSIRTSISCITADTETDVSALGDGWKELTWASFAWPVLGDIPKASLSSEDPQLPGFNREL